MTPVLVLVALPEEARPLRRALRGRPDVHVARTGTGPARARRAARALIAARRPELVLMVGLAGALSERLSVGEVRLVREVRDPRGRVRRPDAVALARARGAGFAEAVLVSAAVPVRGADARERLRRAARVAPDTDVLVDLESVACAAEAVAAGVPWLGLRAVSDGLRDELPSWLVSRERGGEIHRGRVLLGALRRPSRVAWLLRLARRAHAGGRALALALPTLLAVTLEARR